MGLYSYGLYIGMAPHAHRASCTQEGPDEDVSKRVKHTCMDLMLRVNNYTAKLLESIEQSAEHAKPAAVP